MVSRVPMQFSSYQLDACDLLVNRLRIKLREHFGQVKAFSHQKEVSNFILFSASFFRLICIDNFVFPLNRSSLFRPNSWLTSMTVNFRMETSQINQLSSLTITIKEILPFLTTQQPIIRQMVFLWCLIMLPRETTIPNLCFSRAGSSSRIR